MEKIGQPADGVGEGLWFSGSLVLWVSGALGVWLTGMVSRE